MNKYAYSRLARRRLLGGLTGATALGVFGAAPLARAETYPARSAKILVGFPAGGPADLVTRLIAQGLSAELSQPFVVENRPGATGTIASAAVAKSRPDGYNLVVVGPSHTYAPALIQSMPYETSKEFAAVAGLVSSPLMLVVRAESPFKTLADFLTKARQGGQGVSYGSGGTLSLPHLAGELFQRQVGVKLLHVPYKGSAPLRTDLLGGQVDSAMDVATTSIPLVTSGRLRVLGVASAQRLPQMPNAPTFAEQGIPFEVLAWYGMLAPAGTPAPIVDTLNAGIGRILKQRDFVRQIDEAGFQSLPGTPVSFQAFMDAETKRWTTAISSMGFKPQ
ncbi:MAG: Bug family tripartite tricarboxylate transporter substrate binding protein [Burkholderiaceae bacterium]